MRKITSLTVTLIILLFLSFAPGNSQGYGLSVKAVHEIELDSGGLPLLSPDGTMMAMCIHNYILVWTVQGTELLQVEALHYFDRFSLSWSPDAKYLAATDDLLNEFQEPDIWILDVASGSLENLTDDDVTAFPMAQPPPPEANLDQSPVWRGDGKALYFVRINLRNYTNIVSLMQYDIIALSEQMIKEYRDDITYVTHSLAVDPGGKLVYLDHPGFDDTFRMHILDPATGDILPPVQLDIIWNEAFQVYRPAYSADGRWLCVRTYSPCENQREHSVSGQEFTFVAPDSKQLTLRSTETHTLTGFAWNPFFGDEFVYTLIAPEKSGLYWSRPNGQAKLLLEGHFVAEGYGVAYNGSQLKWADNGTILLYDYKKYKLFLAALEIK